MVVVVVLVGFVVAAPNCLVNDLTLVLDGIPSSFWRLQHHLIATTPMMMNGIAEQCLKAMICV